MNRLLVMVIATALALMGCAGFRSEVYSQGKPTPAHVVVPPMEVEVGGQPFSVGYGAASSGGTASRHGWGTGSKGFPERVDRPIR